MSKHDQEISAVLHRVAEQEKIPDFVMPTAAIRPRPRQSKRHWYRWASMSIATAGAVLFAAGVGTYVSPDFSAQVKSLIGQGVSNKTHPEGAAQAAQEKVRALFGQGSLDKGIERATIEGHARSVNASVTDQGITIEVQAIMADPTRVFVSYQIKKTDGTLIDPQEIRKNLEKVIALTDEKNQRLTSGVGGGGDRERHLGYLSFTLEDLDKRPVPDQMKLLIDVRKIGTIKGHWKLEVPFSMKEAIAATRIIPVDGRYTTPQGLQIALHTVTDAPSSTVLGMETKWDEGAKRRLSQYAREMTGKTQDPDYAPYVPYQQYRLEYRILDKNGNDVTAYRNEGKGLEQGMLTEGRGSGDRYGHFTWNTAYVPFGDSGPFTFVLDAVHVTEPADLTFSFQPEKLAAEPKSVEYKGSLFTVKSLKAEDPRVRENSTVLTVEAALRDISSIEYVWWVITDESGKSYPINGASYDSIGKDAQGREIMRFGLDVGEMEQIPKRLTISLSAVTKRYADVDWSVELPVKQTSKTPEK
ncbi:DUF4179 domain-containing protein [Brevibacillus borstelensis]|uniref:DUF4179 domain-containing protein n=1 Tax=Brevibacillus borstelensis TaxID=45462 RepID=UPI0004F3CAAB|nr:DUF4179 domain-containing protein [Brevibacillus borstelensis]KKX54657.1 hypothetical protein X546_12620 [Brevibacillus borstelensis cifa_chp40]